VQEAVIVVQAVLEEDEIRSDVIRESLEEESFLVGRVARDGGVQDLHGSRRACFDLAREDRDEPVLGPGDGIADDEEPLPRRVPGRRHLGTPERERVEPFLLRVEPVSEFLVVQEVPHRSRVDGRGSRIEVRGQTASDAPFAPAADEGFPRQEKCREQRELRGEERGEPFRARSARPPAAAHPRATILGPRRQTKRRGPCDRRTPVGPAPGAGISSPP
jgi:hypothetical protein